MRGIISKDKKRRKELLGLKGETLVLYRKVDAVVWLRGTLLAPGEHSQPYTAKGLALYVEWSVDTS